MKEVYLFNPEHDLALAHGAHNYTAPPFARQFRHDLRLLPSWVAPAGSYIAIPDDCPIDEISPFLTIARLTRTAAGSMTIILT